MPPKHIRDEERWEKAKRIVMNQYGKTEADGDDFWALVTGVYKQARGTIHKKGKGNYFNRKKGGKVVKEKLKEGRERAPKARKGIELYVIENIIKSKRTNLPAGGDWKTIRGAKVYLKDGKVVAGAEGKLSGTSGKASGGTQPTGKQPTGKQPSAPAYEGTPLYARSDAMMKRGINKLLPEGASVNKLAISKDSSGRNDGVSVSIKMKGKPSNKKAEQISGKLMDEFGAKDAFYEVKGNMIVADYDGFKGSDDYYSQDENETVSELTERTTKENTVAKLLGAVTSAGYSKNSPEYKAMQGVIDNVGKLKKKHPSIADQSDSEVLQHFSKIAEHPERVKDFLAQFSGNIAGTAGGDSEKQPTKTRAPKKGTVSDEQVKTAVAKLDSLSKIDSDALQIFHDLVKQSTDIESSRVVASTVLNKKKEATRLKNQLRKLDAVADAYERLEERDALAAIREDPERLREYESELEETKDLRSMAGARSEDRKMYTREVKRLESIVAAGRKIEEEKSAKAEAKKPTTTDHHGRSTDSRVGDDGLVNVDVVKKMSTHDIEEMIDAEERNPNKKQREENVSRLLDAFWQSKEASKKA